MRDVAQAANVSVQTVSNLVNGRTNQMTPETESRVRRVMEKSDYHPNSSARGLRSARARTLGFLVLDEASRFLADPMTDLFMAGLGDVLRERDYALLVQASRPGKPLDRLLLPLLEGRSDGAVVFLSGPPALRRRHIRHLRKLAAPFVLLQEHDVAGSALPVIEADDFGGSRELCRYLISRGHSRIAFLTGVYQWSAIEARFAGYVAAHEEAGVQSDPSLAISQGGFDALSAADAAGLLLDLDHAPTAIMCGNDLIALGALKAARDRGFRVPDDVAVTGFDDFDFAAAVEPPLTTVRLPGYEMGSLAASLLIDFIDGAPRNAQAPFLTEICLRASA